MEISQNNYFANLNKLIRFFEKTDSGYAFAVLQNFNQLEYLNEQLFELLNKRGINLEFVSFDPNSKRSLFAQIKRAINDVVDALIVNNLAELIVEDDYAKKVKDSDFVLELNFAREDLLALNKPILFWISENSLSIINNRAVDLYSQRSINTIFFEAENKEIKQESTRPSFFNKGLSEKKTARLKQKINLIKKQLTDAELGEYPKNEIANTIALPLANNYLEAGSSDKAISLLKKYREYVDDKNRANLYKISNILVASGKLDEAIDNYNEVIKSGVTNHEIEIVAASKFQLAEIFEKKDEDSKAIRLYAQFRKLTNILISKNLGGIQQKIAVLMSFHKEGDIYLRNKEYKKTFKSFSKAYRYAKKLIEQEPENSTVIFTYALSSERYGYVYEINGDYFNALKYYKEYSLISEQFYNASQKLESAQIAFMQSLNLLAQIQYKMGSYSKSIEYNNKLLKFIEGLLQKKRINPRYIFDYAVAHIELAKTYLKLNKTKDALRCLRKFIKHGKELVVESTFNSEIKAYLVNANLIISDIFHEKEDYGNAIMYAKEANEIAKKLISVEKDNLNIKKRYAESLFKLSRLYLILQKNQEAFELSVEFNKLALEFHENQEQNLEYKLMLANSYLNIGNVYEKLGDDKKSLEAYLEYNKICEQVQDKNEMNLQYIENLTYSNYLVMNNYKRLGEQKLYKNYQKKWTKQIHKLEKDYPNVFKYKEWRELPD